MHRTGATLLVAAVVVAWTGVAAGEGAGNEPPLADAGLDRVVERGETVLLDATGSRDPDGRVVGVAWTVAAPDGTATPPDCGDCERTRFVPRRVGRYDVELTVTDDDGARSVDRLYVTVERDDRPRASLSGPGRTRVGTGETYAATAVAPNGSVARLAWTVDGRTVAVRRPGSERATDSLAWTFREPGRHRVAVAVRDAEGRSASDALVVDVATGTGATPARTPRPAPAPAVPPVPDTPEPATAAPPPTAAPTRGAVATATPTEPPSPDPVEVDVQLNDAVRTTWLVPVPVERREPVSVSPTGWAPGAGASGANVYELLTYEEPDEPVRYVDALSEAGRTLTDGTPGPAVTSRRVGLGGSLAGTILP